MRISDWSSDVCSSDLDVPEAGEAATDGRGHCHPDVSPTHTGEVAEQPEHDAASLLGVGGLGDDEGCQRVEELRAGDAGQHNDPGGLQRSEENTSELQSLMRISYAVFGLNKKKKI